MYVGTLILIKLLMCLLHARGKAKYWICEKNLLRYFQYLMNAYSEMKINKDMKNADIDSKAAEAMCLWEPDKNQNEAGGATQPVSNVSGLIRWAIVDIDQSVSRLF